MHLDPKIILLIGYDSNLALGVLFCLSGLGYKFYLLSHNRKNAARFSRFIETTYYYTDGKDDLKQRIIDLCNKHNIDVIFPYDELETRAVTLLKSELEKYAKCLMGTNPTFFDIGIHKQYLAEFLHKHQLSSLPFVSLAQKNLVDEFIRNNPFPILIKPVRMAAGRGIQKLYSATELSEFLDEKNVKAEDYILQPFVVGTDITCNVICINGKLKCHTIQESPVKRGANFSSNDILCYHDDPDVVEVIGSMMQLLHWNGVACIDLRRDEITRKIYVLEINGRFWASVVPSLLKAGVNFPLIMLKLSLGESIEIPKMRTAFQISLKQYLVSLLKFGPYRFKDTKYWPYLFDPIARLAQLTLQT